VVVEVFNPNHRIVEGGEGEVVVGREEGHEGRSGVIVGAVVV